MGLWAPYGAVGVPGWLDQKAFKRPFQLKWFCDALKDLLISAPVQVTLKSLPMQLSWRVEMWQKPFEMWCCKKYWFMDKLIAIVDVHCLFKHSSTEGFSERQLIREGSAAMFH